MSCHYHVFLGPYLEVHNPIQSTTKKIRSCGNPQCGWYKKPMPQQYSNQFCGQCGEKIRHLDVPSSGRKEFNIYDEFKTERLTELCFEGMPRASEDYMYFQSNIKDSAGRTFYDNTAFVPIDETIPKTEMDLFASNFAEEILRIEQVFGKESAKIKWGAVAYWS